MRRDQLAGFAMQGLLAHMGWNTRAELVADKAIEFTDALMQKLDKEDDDAKQVDPEEA
jgi:hypothetical protein